MVGNRLDLSYQTKGKLPSASLNIATDNEVEYGSGTAGTPSSYSFSSLSVPDTVRTARMVENIFGVPLARFGVRANINTQAQANLNAQGLQDALVYISSLTTGSVLVPPPGKIYMGSIASGPGSATGISKITLASNAGKLLGIVGRGSNITQFICVKAYGSNGLLDIYAPDPTNFYYYTGFSILASGVCSGIALKTSCIYGPADIHRSTFKMEDIQIEGVDRSVDYFVGGGIDCQGQWQARIRTVTVASAFPAPSDGTRAGLTAYYSDSSILYKMAFGVNCATCYGISFSDIKIDGCLIGITQDNRFRADGSATPTGTGQPAFEGLSILDFVIQSQKTSINRVGVGGARDAQVLLDNGHCNSRDNTIVINGSKSIRIDNTLLYQDGNIASGQNNPIDIKLTNVERVCIGEGVEFYGVFGNATEASAVDKGAKVVNSTNGTGRINVVIDGSTFAQEMTIKGDFNSYALYGLFISGASFGRSVFAPNFIGAATLTPFSGDANAANLLTFIPNPSGTLSYDGFSTNGNLTVLKKLTTTSLTVNGYDVQVGPWISYTSTITTDSGTLSGASGAGFYQIVGKRVHYRVKITGPSSVSGTGSLNFSLPLGLTAKGTTVVLAEAAGGNFYGCKVLDTDNKGKIYNLTTLAYPVTAANMVFNVAGFYETS